MSHLTALFLMLVIAIFLVLLLVLDFMIIFDYEDEEEDEDEKKKGTCPHHPQLGVWSITGYYGKKGADPRQLVASAEVTGQKCPETINKIPRSQHAKPHTIENSLRFQEPNYLRPFRIGGGPGDGCSHEIQCVD
jgi:hypothetical protein